MAGYHPTANRAFPFLLFFFKELIDAIIPDIFEVLNHAHPVMLPVACIYTAEPLAGKIVAFVTVFNRATQEQLTFLLKEGAILTSWPASTTVGHSDSLTFYIILTSKVCTTYTTIHSTGCN